MHIIIDALGYIMGWCYSLVGNYGLAIIFFTFISKLVLLPLSVWVQFNSIKMIRMQPEINMLKVQYYGDKDRIYEEQEKIYKRDNYNPFLSVIPDLDRIKALGTDIIWLMPIHPIGEKNKKGSLGCPYANRDYRTVNPCYGTMEDFRALVSAIHEKGMKCIIDVVYNHTAPDATLVKEHPEFYYKKPDGSFGNKTADWTDVIDLDYRNRDLWDYQIESLRMWASSVRSVCRN